MADFLKLLVIDGERELEVDGGDGVVGISVFSSSQRAPGSTFTPAHGGKRFWSSGQRRGAQQQNQYQDQ